MGNEIIHDLGAKLSHLANALAELANDDDRTVPGLERRLGMKQGRLKSASKIERWSLSAEVIEQLATAGGFKPDDPWWVDRHVRMDKRRYTVGQGYKGRDTAEVFGRKLRVGLGLDASTKLRLQPDAPEILDGNLLTFELFSAGQAVDEDAPLTLLASISATADVDASGVRFGFKKLRLKLLPTQPGLATGSWLGRPKTTIGNASIVMIGAERLPSWRIDASPDILDGDYTTTDAALCLVHGAKAGDDLVGEVAMQRSDGGSIGTETSVPVAPETEAVLRVIFERELPGSTDSFGWKTLGRHRVRVGHA